jgi:Na+-translocating ferredoxin:NAD+ oxidoreductase subunit E
MNVLEELKRGVIAENPILVLALGLCPALATSTSVTNGLGMGVAVIFVLTASNAIISLIRPFVPARVRIPCFIIVIATFVTMVELSMQAYFPALDRQLGIFVPLIVVNCVILGRAEAFASKNNLARSVVDGVVMGLGFTVALCTLAAVRELLGGNKLFGLLIVPGFRPMSAFVLAPGGFLAIALVMGFVNYMKMRKAKA